MKTLVAYFSAEGTTAAVAKELAEKLGADIFEIRPVEPYSTADIKWTNPLARCNREKIGKKDVPVVGTVPEWERYDLVYLGFPIWHYGAPNVINTFCKGDDWQGKRVVIFATSGGSGIGRTVEKLQPYMPEGQILRAEVIHRAEELEPLVR